MGSTGKWAILDKYQNLSTFEEDFPELIEPYTQEFGETPSETQSKRNGGTVAGPTEYFELWKTNGALDKIIDWIDSEIEQNPEGDKSQIAINIIEDRNFYGSGGDVVKSREHILEQLKEKGHDITWTYEDGGQITGGVYAGRTYRSIPKSVAAIMPYQQQAFLKEAGLTEFQGILADLEKTVKQLPSRAKDLGGDTMVYLHYFYGSADWYIEEFNRGDGIFYGFANLGDDMNAEFGNVGVEELLSHGSVELDFHFEPTEMKNINVGGNPYYKEPEERTENKEERLAELASQTGDSLSGYDFDFSTIGTKDIGKNEKVVMDLLKELGATELQVSGEDFTNGLDFTYKGERFRIVDNTSEFKVKNLTKGEDIDTLYFSEYSARSITARIIELVDISFDVITDLAIERSGLTLEELIKGKDQFEINKLVRKITAKNGIDRDRYSQAEIDLLDHYTGSGGLIKKGEKGARILDQFFTPPEVVSKMWGLAIEHAFVWKGAKILEPAVGNGRFLKMIPSQTVNKVIAYDVDETSYIVSKVLYPSFDIRHGSFESMFFDDHRHVGLLGVEEAFDIVIGNPPYRDYVSEYAPLGEKKATGAFTFDQYFIARGIDVLKPEGLLIFIVPNSFMHNDKKYNDFKNALMQKADLIDAYRLPNGVFETTEVGTDILVFRRKAKSMAQGGRISTSDIKKGSMFKMPNGVIFIVDRKYIEPALSEYNPSFTAVEIRNEASGNKSVQNVEKFVKFLNTEKAIPTSEFTEKALGHRAEGGSVKAHATMKTEDGLIKGVVEWNEYWNKYQVYIDGALHGEFDTVEEGIDELDKAGFTNIETEVAEEIPAYKDGGGISVDGIDLVYETWSTEMGGTGVDGTIRTTPQNKYVATIDSEGNISFDEYLWDDDTKKIDKDKVRQLWVEGMIPKKMAEGGEIDNRTDKKRDALKTLNGNVHRLRRKVTTDLNSKNDKDRLTALVVAIMDRIGERVGNEESASKGHKGVTGLCKSNVIIKGNKVTLKYTGKSAVDHNREFTDASIAKGLKRAIKEAPADCVFETSDNFKIKADRVNRYLEEFDITSKDLRGYSANFLITDRLNKLKPIKEEKARKKKFNEIAKNVAKKIGHTPSTLKTHYLIPEIQETYIGTGKVFDMNSMAEGGSVGAYKITHYADDSSKISSDMFDNLDRAIKAGESKKHWMVMKNLDMSNGHYEWEILPYGDFAKYDIATAIMENGGKVLWGQDVRKEIEKHGTEGLFTKKAKEKGLTSVEFVDKVLENPSRYDIETKREAQFLKNINPEVFDEGGSVKEEAYDVATLTKDWKEWPEGQEFVIGQSEEKMSGPQKGTGRMIGLNNPPMYWYAGQLPKTEVDKLFEYTGEEKLLKWEGLGQGAMVNKEDFDSEAFEKAALGVIRDWLKDNGAKFITDKKFEVGDNTYWLRDPLYSYTKTPKKTIKTASFIIENSRQKKAGEVDYFQETQEFKINFDVLSPTQETFKFKKGGTITCDCKRTASASWKAWTKPQRIHFLSDHGEHGIHARKEFKDLDKRIRDKINDHLIEGSYAKGGSIPKLNKVDTKEDFHHIRVRDPKLFSQIRTPEWGRITAESVVKGAQVRSGKLKKKGKSKHAWETQAILIPVEHSAAKAKKYAREILAKIEK